MNPTTVQLQGTSITTSWLGLGTHSLHRLLRPAARRDLLARALDLGIRHFDTAPLYGDGLAEHEIGRMARGRRDALVLTTKFGMPTRGLGGKVPGWNHFRIAGRALRRLTGSRSNARLPRNYTVAELTKSLDSSLQALRTDYVDILFLHEPSLEDLREPQELARMLEALKASGKIRAVGLSGQVADCQAIAATHPALSQVLQLQLPAGANGLPKGGTPLPVTSQVVFWEFQRGASGTELEHTAACLRTAAPGAVLLLSTHSTLQLDETVTLLGQSATPSLAVARKMRYVGDSGLGK